MKTTFMRRECSGTKNKVENEDDILIGKRHCCPVYYKKLSSFTILFCGALNIYEKLFSFTISFCGALYIYEKLSSFTILFRGALYIYEKLISFTILFWGALYIWRVDSIYLFILASTTYLQEVVFFLTILFWGALNISDQKIVNSSRDCSRVDRVLVEAYWCIVPVHHS